MSTGRLKVGLLGCGTVGRGLVELVTNNHSLIRQRAGVDLGRILVRDLGKDRLGVDRDLLTTQPEKILNNGCDLVVELVGGIEPARTFIRESLERRNMSSRLFCGKGAGSLPSASAVLSDVVDIACHRGGFASGSGETIRPAASRCNSQPYLRFSVADPSTIGRITTILERNRVGVARAAAVWAKNGFARHQVRVLTQASAKCH